MAQDKYVSNYVGTTIDALLKKINELDINFYYYWNYI